MNEIQLRRLDMTLLLVFASITRHQKLSLVADELGVTKSAISHALARLRDIFGDELFLRRQIGLQLTPRALTLAPKIAAIIQLTADALMPEQAFNPLTDRRTLRLGTSEYGVVLFGPLLSEIIEREAPNMRLAVASMRRADLLEQMANYKLDLALASFHGGVGDLEAETLYKERYVVVSRRGHPLTTGRLSRSAYLAAEHIMVMGEARAPVVLETYFTRLGVFRNVVTTLPLYLPAFSTVARSDRLLTVPSRLAAHYAEFFGVDIHPMPFPPVPVAVCLLSHPNARDDAGVAWFRSKVHVVAQRLQSETSALRPPAA